MLIYHRTDLLESNAQVLVNPVNCVGVMGNGIAAELKRRYPEMFKAYQQNCAMGNLKPGTLAVEEFKSMDIEFSDKNTLAKPISIGVD